MVILVTSLKGTCLYHTPHGVIGNGNTLRLEKCQLQMFQKGGSILTLPKADRHIPEPLLFILANPGGQSAGEVQGMGSNASQTRLPRERSST